MGFQKTAKYITICALAAAVGGCAAPGFRADVARFQAQALPVTQGQTFAIAPSDPALNNSLEFESYAAKAAAQLSAMGYRPAADTASADLIVRMGYTVDKGTQKLRASPGFYDPFWDPWVGYRSFGYSRFHRRSALGYRYGYHDPFLFGGGGYDRVEAITVYTSGLDVQIDRRADGKRLFEGKAEARSRDNDLTYLVPNLIEAMFTNFPGNNGEKVRITVAPKKG
jgi:hypothetical protein